MNNHPIVAAAVFAETCQKTESETYRLSIDPKTDPMAYNVIMGMLTKSPAKSDQRANMIMMHRHSETLKWVRQLTPSQLESAAPDIARALKVVIDLKELKNVRQCSEELAKLRNRQIEQCRWLVSNLARNNTIQSICYLLTESEIRKIRDEMGVPAQIGRAAALPLEEQLSVQQVWQTLAENTGLDDFTRYRRLQEAFPQYDLGRLNAALHGI